MVHLTADDCKEIAAVFSKVNVDTLGGQCLARLISVNPWARRYFHDFGDLSSCDAICRNPKVLAHGAKVMRSIVDATKHVDNLREYYADLSTVHCLKFYVDPENFKLFSGIVIVCLALTLHSNFTAHKQHACEKLMKGITHALSHGYH